MRDEPFLTTSEVLAYLKINLQTVYALIRSGRLPAVRVGRQWRLRRSDIDEWLACGPPTTDRTRPAQQPPMSRRVLVVDDDPEIRDLIAKSLRSASYDVSAAPDARTALAFARDEHYDLLITDVMMPGMDGLTFVRELRRHAADLPVILITGFSTEALAIDAANLSVVGYVTKPFRVPQIVAAAARAIA